MDYQPMNQEENQSVNQPATPVTSMDQSVAVKHGISPLVWYVVGAVVVIAVAVWYFYAPTTTAPVDTTESTAVEQGQSVTTGDSATADLSADLDAISDDSAALNQAAAASAADVSGF
jgi:hypothetical protein